MAEKGCGQTNWILEIMKDGGPNAYETTPRPNTTKSYRVTTRAEKRKKKSGPTRYVDNHLDPLPHHLVIIACTLKHTGTHKLVRMHVSAVARDVIPT